MYQSIGKIIMLQLALVQYIYKLIIYMKNPSGLSYYRLLSQLRNAGLRNRASSGKCHGNLVKLCIIKYI